MVYKSMQIVRQPCEDISNSSTTCSYDEKYKSQLVMKFHGQKCCFKKTDNERNALHCLLMNQRNTKNSHIDNRFVWTKWTNLCPCPLMTAQTHEHYFSKICCKITITCTCNRQTGTTWTPKSFISFDKWIYYVNRHFLRPSPNPAVISDLFTCHMEEL